MKVIVIQTDGLQLAPLGAYGNVWLETPNFDRLAASSVVFDQHFADVPSAAGVAHAMYDSMRCLPPMEGEHEVRRGQSVFELLLARKVFCYVSRQNSPLQEPEAAKFNPGNSVRNTQYSTLRT